MGRFQGFFISGWMALLTVTFFNQATLAKPSSKASAPVRTSSPAPAIPMMNSWSSEEVYEIQSSLSGGQYDATKSGTTSVTALNAKLSIAKLIKNNIQGGAELSFYNESGGAVSRSYFQIAGFGVYNLTSILKDTYYVKGGLGLFNTINDTGKDESKFGFFAGGGKRIPLWNQITYSPEARIWKIGSQDMTFSIYFLNLSLFF